jgi:hypothetical protein
LFGYQPEIFGSKSAVGGAYFVSGNIIKYPGIIIQAVAAQGIIAIAYWYVFFKCGAVYFYIGKAKING